MGLFRVVLLGVIVWLVISMMKRYKANNEAVRKRVSTQEKVLKCSTCGVYVPENEAIRVGEKTYCSTEHQLADQSDPDQ